MLIGSGTSIITREFHLVLTTPITRVREGRIIDSTKESQLAAQVSEIMNAKYQWDQGLIVELRSLDLL